MTSAPDASTRHEADLSELCPTARWRIAEDGDNARRWREQPDRQMQQRGLARTIGADETDDLLSRY